MRGRLISTGCKAAVAGGKRRRKKKFLPHPRPRQNLPKGKEKEEMKGAPGRSEGLDICSAPHTGPVLAPQPVARVPAAPLPGQPRRGAGSAAGVGRRGPWGGGRPSPHLAFTPSRVSRPSPPQPPPLSILSRAPSPPPRCLCQRGRSGEAKILIQQSPPRNGHKRAWGE